jgi:energy-coupling factor transport system ATP-binding protein
MQLAFIEADNVCFWYDEKKKIITDLDLKIESGSFTAIMGPNGSGKTTIGKLIMGILKPGSGTILIDGTDTKSMSLGEAGSKIGYLFQNPEFQIFSHTVLDELTFIPRLKGIDGGTINREAERLLELLHLEDKKDIPTFNLSYGEKQRLAIAGILVVRPRYLILDEPTTGLDPVRREVLISILRKLLDEEIGITVITHDSRFISDFSGRLLKIDEGRIIETGIK